MPDQADYLARVIVQRMRSLEAGFDEEGLGADRRAEGRAEMVAKVLAVELGLTDGAVVRLVTEAAPRVAAHSDVPAREQSAYAVFLRRQLKL